MTVRSTIAVVAVVTPIVVIIATGIFVGLVRIAADAGLNAAQTVLLIVFVIIFSVSMILNKVSERKPS